MRQRQVTEGGKADFAKRTQFLADFRETGRENEAKSNPIRRRCAAVMPANAGFCWGRDREKQGLPMGVTRRPNVL